MSVLCTLIQILFFCSDDVPSSLPGCNVKKQTFAIRFASSEIAQEYKAEFTKAQAEMQKLLNGGDSTEGTAVRPTNTSVWLHYITHYCTCQLMTGATNCLICCLFSWDFTTVGGR